MSKALKLFQVVGPVRCPDCGTEFEFSHWYVTCPNCKASGIVMRTKKPPRTKEATNGSV